MNVLGPAKRNRITFVSQNLFYARKGSDPSNGYPLLRFS
jgi:hypothetical protein